MYLKGKKMQISWQKEGEVRQVMLRLCIIIKISIANSKAYISKKHAFKQKYCLKTEGHLVRTQKLLDEFLMLSYVFTSIGWCDKLIQ